MTTQQLLAFGALYLLLSIVVALFTRANARRIVSALVGAVAGPAREDRLARRHGNPA